MLIGLLAITDGWVIGMWVVNLLATIILAVIMTGVAARTRKIEQLEDSLATKAEQLVDAKVAVRFGELATSIATLTVEVRKINERLEHGEQNFDHLGDRATQTQISIANERTEFYRHLADRFATKSDVGALERKLDSLGEAIRQIEVTCATIHRGPMAPATAGRKA